MHIIHLILKKFMLFWTSYSNFWLASYSVATILVDALNASIKLCRIPFHHWKQTLEHLQSSTARTIIHAICFSKTLKRSYNCWFWNWILFVKIYINKITCLLIWSLFISILFHQQQINAFSFQQLGYYLQSKNDFWLIISLRARTWDARTQWQY